MKKVTAAVIERKGTIMIAKRGRSGGAAGKWEFPGGGIEPGETPEQCLARELREELGITSLVGEFIASCRVMSEGSTLELLAFRVLSFTGEVRVLVHEEVRWVVPEDLSSFDLAEADRLLLPKILAGRPGQARGEE